MEFVEVPGGVAETGTLNRAESMRRFLALPRGDADAANRLEFNEPDLMRHYLPARRYLLGRTEVTVAQFREFVRSTGYKTDAERAGDKKTWATQAAAESDRHPVVYVTWDDAQAFCRWLTKVQGRGVCRLPTDVEWEWACRPGWKNPDGSDDASSLGRRANGASPELGEFDRAWASGLKLTDRDGFATAAPVGSFPPNGRGLHDMVGNVSEWTATRWLGGLFRADILTVDKWRAGDEVAYAKDDIRFVRGGSWWGGGFQDKGIGGTGFAGASATTPTRRDTRSADVGFRVLWDDRPGAVFPADDLPYSEIDRLIIKVIDASLANQDVDRLPEFARLVGQGERAAARLVYALQTVWGLGDPRPSKALEAAVIALGPVAAPALERAAERWERYRKDYLRAAGWEFGIEREELRERAWGVIPVDSQPRSRTMIQLAEAFVVLLNRGQTLGKRLPKEPGAATPRPVEPPPAVGPGPAAPKAPGAVPPEGGAPGPGAARPAVRPPAAAPKVEVTRAKLAGRWKLDLMVYEFTPRGTVYAYLAGFGDKGSPGNYEVDRGVITLQIVSGFMVQPTRAWKVTSVTETELVVEERGTVFKLTRSK